ncbi:MAG: LacI family transcriptional regulator [Actinomycetia bacterium]|nr:LacI family transcriptional regulator [Actinomycetes bacterium]
MAVTVSDIAAQAGVSVSTVSRALAGSTLVSPETMRRVAEVASQLNYRPNLMARGLSTGKTECLGLLVPDLENPFFSTLAKGIQSHARRRGYSVLMADTDEDATMESDLVRRLASQSDGVIVCSPRSGLDEIQTWPRTVPLVLVNRLNEGMSSVIVDDADGIRQAVLHLAALGHARIAYAGGPQASWSDRTRRAAFHETMASLPDAEAIDLGCFQPQYHSGAAAADLAHVSGATAAIAYNDLVAIGLVQRLQSRGVAIPRDFSVVGIDGIPQSSWSSPTLTTVSTVRRSLARTSVHVLLDNTEVPQTHVVPVELIVRASTGEAPAGTLLNQALATSGASIQKGTTP